MSNYSTEQPTSPQDLPVHVDPQQHRFSRRDLLKLGGLGVDAALAALFTQNKTSEADIGFTAEGATFFTSYRRHGRVEINDFSASRMDAIFVEMVFSSQFDFPQWTSAKDSFLSHHSYEDIISGGITVRSKESITPAHMFSTLFGMTETPDGQVRVYPAYSASRNLSTFVASKTPQNFGNSSWMGIAQDSDRKILKRTLMDNMRVIIADTNVTREDIEQFSAAQYQHLVVGALTSLGLASDVVKQLDEGEHVKPMSRRDFLRLAALCCAGLAGINVSGQILSRTFETEWDRSDALQRIQAEVVGMTHHLRPDVLVVYFRNLMIADKLLLIAEKLKQEGVGKPVIGVSVNPNHSGIRYLLPLGRDTIRKLILAFGTDVLDRLAVVNAGVDEFCSAFLVGVKPGVSPNADTIPADSFYREKVLDEELRDAIMAKLGEKK